MFLCFIKHHTMKAHGGVEVQFHRFLTVTLGGIKWLDWGFGSCTFLNRAKVLKEWDAC